MDIVAVKKELIELCKTEVYSQMKSVKEAMDQAQSDANSHVGAMESRYDTFKEEAQYLRDGYARRLYDLQTTVSVLIQLQKSVKKMDIAAFGAIVVTSDKTYFLSTSVFQRPFDFYNWSILPIGLSSPLGRALVGKKANDVVSVVNKNITIISVL